MKKILFIAVITLAIVSLIALIIFMVKGKKESEVHITHDVIIHQIEELGKLEVVKYNIQDIIEYKKMRKWLPNSRTSLKVAGEVIACVDLTRIEAGDIYTKGDSVSLTLPIPEVCHHKIDHSRSQVYYVEYGLWETADLVDEAYREAEHHIYQEALKMGIASESRENTIKVLTPILRGLGFTKIFIGFRDPQQNIILPEVSSFTP